MALGSRAWRDAMVVRHPIVAGYVWGAAVIALILLANMVFAANEPLTTQAIAIRVGVFLVASPLWGLLTRQSILRKAEHAR